MGQWHTHCYKCGMQRAKGTKALPNVTHYGTCPYCNAVMPWRKNPCYNALQRMGLCVCGKHVTKAHAKLQRIGAKQVRAGS